MVGGAAPRGRPQVNQEGHVGRAGEHGTLWAGGEGKLMDRLSGRGSSGVWYHDELEYHRMRGRGSSGVWHHGELEYHRTRPWGAQCSTQYAKGEADLWPQG